MVLFAFMHIEVFFPVSELPSVRKTMFLAVKAF